MASLNPTTLSPLESLPNDVLRMILDLSEGPSNQGKISEVSRRLRAVNKLREEIKLNMVDKIAKYLPRALTDEEKRLPAYMKLSRVKKLINQTDQLGRTPLIKATIAAGFNPRALEAMQMLIFLGAEIDKKIDRGFTAERFANSWNIPGALELLQKMREVTK